MSHDHIPDAEILQDITDTEWEIETMEREAISLGMLPDRLSQMRASARRTGIKEREAFITKLQAILADRAAPSQEPT